MSSFTPVTTRTAFRPVGRCIYCDSTKELGEEHIVPYGLGGKFVLPEASCRSCAKVTNEQIENPLLGKMLLPIRTVLGARTRNPKDRPRDFGVRVRSADGNERLVRVPAEDAPLAALGLIMPEPGVLVGRPPNTSVEVGWVPTCDPSRTLEAVGLGPGKWCRWPISTTRSFFASWQR